MIYDIFNFLTGYVYVRIEGNRLERLLNCGISFWNIKRCGYGCVYANVSYNSYKRLLKNSEVSVSVIYEKGLFSLLKRLWGRRVIFFGLCLCCIGWFILSEMVITINLKGYYSLKEEEIAGYVSEYGITSFSFKRKIDLDGLCSFLKEKDNIAWASAGYNGVVLNIEIIEQVNEYDNTPCDIVCDRQAVIKKMDVYSGVRNKQVGDVVNAGELLVAGVIQRGEDVDRIKARADIIGTVWEKESYIFDVTGLSVNNTGNNVKERYIDFWGNKSYIQRDENSFKHYVVSENIKQIGILPIKYVDRTYNEVIISYNNEDVNIVTEKAGYMAFLKASEKLPKNAEIVNVETSYEMNEGYIKADCTIEANVKIGIEAPTY